jgi:hypothetical protein
MPTFDTGNAQWDQNLSSLGNALFPDPSKAAQGYYYGAEARKAQLESNRIIQQQNDLARFKQMQPDSEQPLAPQTYSQPPLTGAAPIPNPPSNLPMGMSTVVPGPVAGPPGAGRIVPQTMTPAQAAAQTPASAAPLMRGTPAPTGAPVPGASPQTPQNTGSDGSVPTNDAASGVMHPGSITDPNGGIKISGPAAPNGSPARTPVSLATYVAQAAAAGMDAAQASLQGQAYLASLYQQGRISRDTYHQLLGGAGQPTLATADTAAAASVKGAQIGAGATIGAAKIREGGETGRKGMEMVFVPDPDNPGQGTFKPLSQLQRLGGTRAANPQTAVTQVTPVLTQPGGPGTPPISQPAYKAPGQQIYPTGTEDIRQQQQGAIKNWIDPKNPTVLVPGNIVEARANGWVAVPQTMEEWTSLANYAAANAPPDQAEQIRARVLQNATAMAPKPIDAAEAVKRGVVIDQRLAMHLPVPASAGYGAPTATAQNQLPSGAGPELDPVLNNLTQQYLLYGPREARENPSTAADMAIAQLLRQKYINPQQSRTMARPYIGGGTTVVNRPTLDGGTSEAFRIELMNPKTGEPYAPGEAPSSIPMDRAPLSPTVAPFDRTAPPATPRPPAAGPAAAPTTAAPARLAPGADMGPASGIPEGHTGTAAGGQRAVVRNGRWTAQ